MSICTKHALFFIIFVWLIHARISSEGLHLRRIQSSHTFFSFFFFIILVNPFCPIYLNVLIFSCAFWEARPIWFVVFFFLKYYQQMKPSFSPLRLLNINLTKQFNIEIVFFRITNSIECYFVNSQIDFLFCYIPESYL